MRSQEETANNAIIEQSVVFEYSKTIQNQTLATFKTTKKVFAAIAEEAYQDRCVSVDSNKKMIEGLIYDKYKAEFASLRELCPRFGDILSHMFVLRLGWRVGDVDWTSDMKDWTEEVSEC